MTKNLLALHSLDTLLEMNMKKHKMKKMSTAEIKKFMKEIVSNEVIREISEKEYIKTIKREPKHYEEHEHSVCRLYDYDDGCDRFYKNKKEVKKCQKNY